MIAEEIMDKWGKHIPRGVYVDLTIKNMMAEYGKYCAEQAWKEAIQQHSMLSLSNMVNGGFVMKSPDEWWSEFQRKEEAEMIYIFLGSGILTMNIFIYILLREIIEILYKIEKTPKEGGNKMTVKEAIETFGRLRHYIQTDVNRYGGGWDSIVEAIDTVVNEVEKPPITERDMHLNMQYYMEYCQMKGYVTPMEWIEKHKHF